jgi:hypothetical protein
MHCRVRRLVDRRKDKAMDEKENAVMDAGVQYGIQMLQQLPKGDRLAMEAHMIGVLIAFWGALWGTFGTEYARGFIEAQLRGMEPDVPHERFTEPSIQ